MTKEQKHQEFLSKLKKKEEEYGEPKYENYHAATRSVMMGMFYFLCEKSGYDISEDLTTWTR